MCPAAHQPPHPLQKTMSLAVAIRIPVPLAPLPKGGWHGEAVTGGFFFSLPTRKKPPEAMASGGSLFVYQCRTDYKPAATMQSSTRVKITNTAPTHLVAFASLASMVRALPLDI